MTELPAQSIKSNVITKLPSEIFDRLTWTSVVFVLSKTASSVIKILGISITESHISRLSEGLDTLRHQSLTSTDIFIPNIEFVIFSVLYISFTEFL